MSQESDVSKMNQNNNSTVANWQTRLLPLMVGMLVLLALFFFVASLIQVSHIKQSLTQTPKIKLDFAEDEQTIQGSNSSPRDFIEFVRWKKLAELELYVINRRYQQANQILLARVWIIYLGFVTGMILALVGAAFILGKLRDSGSQFDAETSVWKFSVTTASPGLILAILGTVLMVTTIVARSDIKVTDSALYLRPMDLQLLDLLQGRLPDRGQPTPFPKSKTTRESKTDPNSKQTPSTDNGESKLDEIEKKAKERLRGSSSIRSKEPNKT